MDRWVDLDAGTKYLGRFEEKCTEQVPDNIIKRMMIATTKLV